MRVAAGGVTLLGASSLSAGLWGLWGWPAAALFVGALLLGAGATLGAELAKRGGR